MLPGLRRLDATFFLPVPFSEGGPSHEPTAGQIPRRRRAAALPGAVHRLFMRAAFGRHAEVHKGMRISADGRRQTEMDATTFVARHSTTNFVEKELP